MRPERGRLPNVRTMTLRVLIACEFSGIVRDAFRAKGHDAWSCDLLPTEKPGPHFQADLWNMQIGHDWDLMIAHPPCTHLAVSGARWFKGKEREQRDALNFVRMLLSAPVPRIALENPVSIISTRIRKPDQIIQPWQFGHPESKTTCLWLKNLPQLTPTKIMEPIWMKNPDGTDYRDKKNKRYSPSHYYSGRMQKQKNQIGLFAEEYKGVARWANQTPSGQNKLGPSPDRWKLRSATYQGIADAMAAQWG